MRTSLQSVWELGKPFHHDISSLWLDFGLSCNPADSNIVILAAILPLVTECIMFLYRVVLGLNNTSIYLANPVTAIFEF